jgi:hypothetical protein
MNLIKKGAMFGLDARIALAIFGALSVISGAALYSAIQEARVTAIITELDELDKASTSYLLDTGNYLPALTAVTTLDAAQLVTSTVSGWQGPYISYSVNGTNARLLDHPSNGEIAIIGALTGTWSDAVASAAGTKCLTTSTTCAVFTCFNGVSNDIQAAIEKKIDGDSGAANTGSIRYTNGSYICKQGAVFPTSSAVN